MPLKTEPKFETIEPTLEEFKLLSLVLAGAVYDEDGDEIEEFSLCDSLFSVIDTLSMEYNRRHSEQNVVVPLRTPSECHKALKRIITVLETLFDDFWDLSAPPSSYSPAGQTKSTIPYMMSRRCSIWDDGCLGIAELPTMECGNSSTIKNFKYLWEDSSLKQTIYKRVLAYNSADTTYVMDMMAYTKTAFSYAVQLALSSTTIGWGLLEPSVPKCYVSKDAANWSLRTKNWAFLAEPYQDIFSVVSTGYSSNFLRDVQRVLIEGTDATAMSSIDQELILSKITSFIIMMLIVTGKISASFMSGVEILRFNDAINSIIEIHREVLRRDPIILNYIRDFSVPDDVSVEGMDG